MAYKLKINGKLAKFGDITKGSISLGGIAYEWNNGEAPPVFDKHIVLITQAGNGSYNNLYFSNQTWYGANVAKATTETTMEWRVRASTTSYTYTIYIDDVIVEEGLCPTALETVYTIDMSRYAEIEVRFTGTTAASNKELRLYTRDYYTRYKLTFVDVEGASWSVGETYVDFGTALLVSNTGVKVGTEFISELTYEEGYTKQTPTLSPNIKTVYQDTVITASTFKPSVGTYTYTWPSATTTLNSSSSLSWPLLSEVKNAIAAAIGKSVSDILTATGKSATYTNIKIQGSSSVNHLYRLSNASSATGTPSVTWLSLSSKTASKVSGDFTSAESMIGKVMYGAQQYNNVWSAFSSSYYIQFPANSVSIEVEYTYK